MKMPLTFAAKAKFSGFVHKSFTVHFTEILWSSIFNTPRYFGPLTYKALVVIKNGKKR